MNAPADMLAQTNLPREPARKERMVSERFFLNEQKIKKPSATALGKI